MPNMNTERGTDPNTAYRFDTNDVLIADYGAQQRTFVATDALLGDQAVEAMVLAAAHPAHDNGHTDTYYRGLIQAAIDTLTRPSTGTQPPA